MNFLEFLKKNPYPGRGIAVGRNRVYYFIMGRSENSRNRIFVETEDGIRTEAFDPAKVVDPSLIIYHPVRRVGGDLIVTNGDQTDTIRDIGLTTRTSRRASQPCCMRTAASAFRSSSASTGAACVSSLHTKAATRARVTSSAPIRARVLPCRVFRENRCPSTCPSPRPSGKP